MANDKKMTQANQSAYVPYGEGVGGLVAQHFPTT